MVTIGLVSLFTVLAQSVAGWLAYVALSDVAGSEQTPVAALTFVNGAVPIAAVLSLVVILLSLFSVWRASR
jgi:hypothetical protein